DQIGRESVAAYMGRFPDPVAEFLPHKFISSKPIFCATFVMDAVGADQVKRRFIVSSRRRIWFADESMNIQIHQLIVVFQFEMLNAGRGFACHDDEKIDEPGLRMLLANQLEPSAFDVI